MPCCQTCKLEQGHHPIDPFIPTPCSMWYSRSVVNPTHKVEGTIEYVSRSSEALNGLP